MDNIDILYYSCPYDLSGYGTVSRNHLMGLSHLKNLNIRLRTRRFWSGVSPDLGEKKAILQGLESTRMHNKGFIFIEHLTPENFYIDPRASYHIAYTPFETDSIPPKWLLPLRGMDEIWVPSQNNRMAYINGGLSREKIFVIPHGVDINKYNSNVVPLKYNRGRFNFGSIFDWTERKNPTALIRAYYNAFTRGEDVTLTIRTFWRFPIEKSQEFISGEIQKIKSGYSGRTSFPRILLWINTMGEDIVPNFYRSFDCFVLPSRGEGFGLPLIEAMACSIPTIGSAWGGNTDFMTKDNSILVGGNIVPIDNHRFLSIQPQYSGQRWFDVNEEELSVSMRWVYDNPHRAMEIASKAVSDIEKNWTWDNTIGKIYKRILEITSKSDAILIKN